MGALAEQIDELDELELVVPVQKLTLECSACGYGVERSSPPERCPMCQVVDAWEHAAWRPCRGRSTG